MKCAEKGDMVKVFYKGKLEDGTVFSSNMDGKPLRFALGESRIIPGFQEIVEGMKPGESKTATIPAEKAFGTHQSELVGTISRDTLPEEFNPEAGKMIELKQDNGEKVVATITDFTNSLVQVDANHPLADEDITFEIKLDGIEK